MRFKVGDRVRVALEGSGYIRRMRDTFKKNNIVEIVLACENDCKIRDYLGNYWWVRYKDIIGLDNQCGYFIS